MDKMIKGQPVHGDPLNSLKDFTAARIGLGRAGVSVPVKQSLRFNLAHAHARDAVYSVLDTEALLNNLKSFNLPILTLHSKAVNRTQYLQNPSLGRQLNAASLDELKAYKRNCDVAFILADGLSATAINKNAPGLLQELMPLLLSAKLKLSPLCLIEQGRVAIGDETGYFLNAKIAVVLIGERPGLSAADSIGVYLTYGPKPGLTDESRNCVSNIRPQGLDFKTAAGKIFYLVREAFRLKLSGVELKDNHRQIGR